MGVRPTSTPIRPPPTRWARWTPAERADFEAHLANCALCAAEVRSFAPVVGALGMTNPAAVPSPAVRDRLLERDPHRVARRHAVRRRPGRFRASGRADVRQTSGRDVPRWPVCPGGVDRAGRRARWLRGAASRSHQRRSRRGCATRCFAPRRTSGWWPMRGVRRSRVSARCCVPGVARSGAHRSRRTAGRAAGVGARLLEPIARPRLHRVESSAARRQAARISCGW